MVAPVKAEQNIVVGDSYSAEVASDGNGLAYLADVLARSLTEGGGLTADAASMAALRQGKTREAVLREFVIGIVPAGVNPALWLDWLRGGCPPPVRVKPQRPDTGGQSLERGLSRSSARVAKAKGVVAQAKAAAARADLQVTKAEASLAEVAAQDAAIVQYAVSEHLVRIMAPMFAMGPAWVVMRALSAHVPANEMADELRVVADPRRRPARAAAVRQKRERESEAALTALDHWAGDEEFERDLRQAIVGLADEYSRHRPTSATARSLAAMRRGVANQTLANEAVEVLDGMRREPF